MKLIFIRHGDPDYSVDSLTEKGWREAECLSKRIEKWENITDIYVSPLGRAKDTASLSLKKLNRTAIEKDWLREFAYNVYHEDLGHDHIPWDFYPERWANVDLSYDKDNWTKHPLIPNPLIEPKYKEVCDGIDEILKEHGYTKKDNVYITDGKGNDDTLVFFCHLGVTFLILGYLLGISPFLIMHDFFIAPTSVTILGSEERKEGVARFRVQTMGDTRHLSECGEPISSSGYFTDCFQG